MRECSTILSLSTSPWLGEGAGSLLPHLRRQSAGGRPCAKSSSVCAPRQQRGMRRPDHCSRASSPSSLTQLRSPSGKATKQPSSTSSRHVEHDFCSISPSRSPVHPFAITSGPTETLSGCRLGHLRARPSLDRSRPLILQERLDGVISTPSAEIAIQDSAKVQRA